MTNYQPSVCLKYLHAMFRYLLVAGLIFSNLVSFAQSQLTHKKGTYIDSDGKLYVNKQLGLYVWLSTSPDEKAQKYRLFSEASKAYSNPMYLDTDGFNTLRSPSAVDTVTHKTVLPMQDIVFEIYADETAPTTTIDYKVNPFQAEHKINLGTGTEISLAAKDLLSGVDAIYYSLDGAPYQPYTTPLKIEQEKEYSLKFYAVDHVGNVEEVHTRELAYDKTSPVTQLTIDVDQYENILSSQSAITLSSEDKGIGVKHIYYKLDNGPEKVYTGVIQAKYISQDEHTITYYATDKVGNKEAERTYAFYVDKTAPTIIEEVMGKSFFSGGKEYSSGKARLKLTSFDNKAGVKEIRYSVNNGEFLVYDKPVFLTQSSGVLTIQTYAVDNVNNRSSSQLANQKTNIPYIDLTGPKLAYSIQGASFTTRDTLFINATSGIVLKGTDSEAGMNHIEYSLNDSTTKEYSNAIKVASEGYSTIAYTGFDNVDNTSSSSFSFKVDNTGPKIQESFGTSRLGMENGIAVYPAHTILFVTANDVVVGLQRITYCLNNAPVKESTGMFTHLPKGKNQMTITAYDKLGNTSEKTITFIVQ